MTPKRQAVTSGCPEHLKVSNTNPSFVQSCQDHKGVQRAQGVDQVTCCFQEAVSDSGLHCVQLKVFMPTALQVANN